MGIHHKQAVGGGGNSVQKKEEVGKWVCTFFDARMGANVQHRFEGKYPEEGNRLARRGGGSRIIRRLTKRRSTQ